MLPTPPSRSASKASSPTRGTDRALVLYLAAVLVAAGGLLAREAWFDSLTYDEAAYVDAGLCAWRTGRIDQLEPTNPPLAKLTAGLGVLIAGPDLPVPGNCGELGSAAYTPAVNRNLHRFVFTARLGTMALTLATIVLVAWWGRALLNRAAAAVAGTLVGFEPIVLGHGHLGTSDMWLTAGALATIAGSWLGATTGRLRWWAAAGAAAGFATASRANGLVLLPLAGLVALLLGPFNRERLRGLVRGGAVMTAAAWLALWVVYLPFDTVLARNEYRLPGPLVLLAPRPFLWGLAFQLRHATERGVDSTYLNGEFHDGGVWFYFLEAIALKTTLPLLALTIAGVVATVLMRDRLMLVAVVLPALTLVAVPSAGSINIGVRYVLAAYPFLALVAASVVRLRHGRARVVVVPSVVIVVATSVLLGASSLAYFNPLAGSRPERYLLDSNIDWGQDAWRLKSWWEDNDEPPLTTMFFGPKSPAEHGITNAVEVKALAAACNSLRPFAVSLMYEQRTRLPACLRGRMRSMIGSSIALYA